MSGLVKEGGKYTAVHSISDRFGTGLPASAGIVEVNRMRQEVLKEYKDMVGGNWGASPEHIADWYCHRIEKLLEIAHGREIKEVERGLRLLDIFEEEMSKPRTKGDGDWALRIILRIVEERGDPTTSEE